jgi:hypothetical protein
MNLGPADRASSTSDVVVCQYCGDEALLWTLKQWYGDRWPDDRYLWACSGCMATVGCHGNTTKPKGTLANEELRKHRRYAHQLFDVLWKQSVYIDTLNPNDPQRKPSTPRKRAYSWLAKQLGIQFYDCHIGMFDEERCQQVVAVCRAAIEQVNEQLNKRADS